MYVHAYQSMIWNNTVSKKFAKHGLEARVGDLVAKHPGADKVATKDVVVLTEENVGDFGIYDVVMPLVGHDVIFPENETKAWMWELFTQGEMGVGLYALSECQAGQVDFILISLYILICISEPIVKLI